MGEETLGDLVGLCAVVAVGRKGLHLLLDRIELHLEAADGTSIHAVRTGQGFSMLNLHAASGAGPWHRRDSMGAMSLPQSMV